MPAMTADFLPVVQNPAGVTVMLPVQEARVPSTVAVIEPALGWSPARNNTLAMPCALVLTVAAAAPPIVPMT
jgi:hypothetical protein